jgi:hypothetical protein
MICRIPVTSTKIALESEDVLFDRAALSPYLRADLRKG